MTACRSCGGLPVANPPYTYPPYNIDPPYGRGLRALPNKSTSFASTQAAWRFYKNDRITLTKLHEPLLIAAHEGIATHCSQYALCAHDWSRLNYRKHASKQDKYPITHETDVGYDLQSSLILSLGNSGCERRKSRSLAYIFNQVER